MRHTPQHPDNPCRSDLPEDERIPAKIWELLRRNELFRLAVERLQELDRTPNDPNGIAWTRAYRLLQFTQNRRPFAGCALEWLVPQPRFVIRKVVALPDPTSPSGKAVSVETTFEGEGTTPNPDDRDQWRWEEVFPGQPRVSASLMRRGPIVEWQTSIVPSLQDAFDPLKEWRDYQNKFGAFTLEHSWKNAPPQFRRTFCWLWRRQDSRATDPITGMRRDAANPHETNFFNGWNLISAVVEGRLSEEEAVHALMFNDLASHYRVFAIPKTVRSRTEAAKMGRWLAQQLCALPDGAKLPLREPDVFGTALEWDVFLFARTCDEASLRDAYRRAKPAMTAAERKRKWRKERDNYMGHFRAIEAQIRSIYPGKRAAG